MPFNSCSISATAVSSTTLAEALRQDDKFAYVSCWEYKGENAEPELHKEELVYETVKMVQRNYK